VTLDDLPTVRRVPTVTVAQMAEADRFAMRELHLSGERLMENAAHQVAVTARLMLGSVPRKRIVALIGYGDNGGDAAGALRRLAGWGAEVIAEVVSSDSTRARPSQGRELGLLGAAPGLVRYPLEGDRTGSPDSRFRTPISSSMACWDSTRMARLAARSRPSSMPRIERAGRSSPSIFPPASSRTQANPSVRRSRQPRQ